jgi:hypothetical protein
MWNKKLFLLVLIAVLCASLSAVIIACSTKTSSSSSDDDSTDDDFTPTDDDNDDNDTTTDDDDDNDDDNDTSPTGGACGTVANDVITTCGLQLPDAENPPVDVTAAQATTWCELTDALYNSDSVVPSAFWSCMDGCAVGQFCSQTCFTNCLTVTDPGGTACGHAVYLVYSCGVEFLFNAPNNNYWIPGSDAIATCATTFSSSTPWSCIATCYTTAKCTNPPTQDEANAMITCMNACGNG